MKQIMKTNKQGIMQIPDKGKVDFGEMIIKEDLFKKGIDPKMITSEKQLDNILNTPNVAPKVKPKKSGEVIDVDFDKGRWKDIDPEKKAGGGIAGLGERTPMQKGNRALTNVQNEFLKLQLKNNPEFIAEYFPNIIDEGPVSKYETNVPYDTPGSRLNIKALRPEYDPFRRGPPRFDVANIAAQEQFYEDKPIAKGQTQAINVNPNILASYGTAASSPRNEMVPTPDWFKKIAKLFDLEVGPTTDQATLNDTIKHIIAHEAGHGVSGLKFYQPDTEEATTSSFSEFLTANQKQSKKTRDAHDLSKLDLDEREGYAFIQEELFNRMKDIERLKKAHPDNYEDHPLWDLYYNRAQKKFAELTGGSLSKFELYEKKIKPSVDKYFERVEKKGKGMSDINIEKEEIGMPENLTRVETPYVSRARPHEAQGGQIGLAYGGRASSGLNYLLGEDDQNARVPVAEGGRTGFAGGKLAFDAARRAFLKIMGGTAAGVGVAKSGLLSLLKGGGKKAVIKDLTSVPIKDISGMPVWFKPLVNRVIAQGDDVSKRFATGERQIVHTTKLPNSQTDVIVTQDIASGNVSVDIGMGKHGWVDGHFGQPVRLEYRAGEVLEGPIKKGKPTKTKEEFNVEEAEFTGGHPENVKFEDVSIEKFGNHQSNFDEVAAFAKGKTKKTRKISSLQKEGEDLADHFSNYPTPDDFASGGRVPLGGGGIALKIIALLKNPKKIRAAVDDIFPTGDYKYDAQMAAEALVENNPKVFGGKLMDDLDDATRSEVYGAVIGPIQQNALMISKMKKATKPTKTLEGIEKTGTIDISDPNVADEFSRFMKETDPKGHRKIEEIVEITNFDPKGRKKNAFGGLAGLLGE